MSCSRVIAVGLAAAAIDIGADGGEPPSRPNVILIMADDLGPSAWRLRQPAVPYAEPGPGAVIGFSTTSRRASL